MSKHTIIFYTDTANYENLAQRAMIETCANGWELYTVWIVDGNGRATVYWACDDDYCAEFMEALLQDGGAEVHATVTY